MSAIWAGIVRVSFVGTRGGDSFHADEEQVADIERAIAGMKGASLHMMTPELDVSGGLPLEQRPSLLAAVEGVERGEYAGIIVAYLSRLGRNVREQLRAWDRVEAAGGRIIVVREGIDTSTAHGRLQRTILLGIAEHEREMHTERFEERRRLATKAGIWQRRQIPHGYRRDPDTRKLVPGDDAKQVADAFRRRASGASISSLAADLAMTPSGVRSLLANRLYLGELKVGRHVNVAAHPALVTVEEWEAAQAKVSRPPRNFDGPALLAGLARCQACGHVMSRRRTGDVVYACAGRSSAGRCPAPAAVTARLLDRHVEEIALWRLAVLGVESVGRRDRDGEARDRLARAEAELAAYLGAVSAADVGAQAFAEGARSRREKVDAAREDVRRRAALTEVVDIGPDALAGWERLGDAQRNRLLRALLEVVVVRRGGGRGSRTPLGERVRVLAAGTWVAPRKHGSDPLGIVGLPFPDADDERVLRVPGGE